MRDFINDKTAELKAALTTGNSDRAAKVLIETILESGDTFEATVTQMTETDRRQNDA
jgi:hypothetical protein